MKKGKLIIISAPSGSGEIDGVHYHFLTVEQFKEAIKNDALVEYEEVYPGRFYGTLKSEIERIQNNGKNVILDIDVKGGINVRRLYGDNALSVFIQPPSIEALRQRLISRATDPIEAINQRVGKAEYELSFKDQFDTVVVNDNLDKAVEQTRQLLYDFVK